MSNKATDDTSILKCIITIAKDEKYQKLSLQREIIKNKLRNSIGNERNDLLIQQDNISNELKNCAQIIVGKMDG